MSEIGPIDRVIFIGGGPQIVSFADWVKKQGKQTFIISSPRHAVEHFGGYSLADAARQEAIEFHITDNLDSTGVASVVGSMEQTIAISFGAAWIFKMSTISGLFDNKLFNVHGTRLPQNRGGGGWSWQAMMRNRFGFNAIHRIDGGIDTGAIIAINEFIYPSSCRVPLDYMKQYEVENFHFVTEFLFDLFAQKREFIERVQPEYLSTYWPRLSTSLHGWIDWSWDADTLDRFICSFDSPYAGASTKWNDVTVQLKSVCVDYNDPRVHPFQSGLVFRKNKSWIVVAATGGSLVVQGVFSQDKNVIQDVKLGDRFHTPAAELEARSKRVIYKPRG